MINTGSGDWNSPSTWNVGFVPTSSSFPSISYGDPLDPGKTYTVTLNGQGFYLRLDVDNYNTLALNGAQLNSAASGRTTLYVSASGILLAQSGNNAVWGDVYNDAVPSTSGLVRVAGNATLWIERYESTGGLLQVDNGGSMKVGSTDLSAKTTVSNAGRIALSSTGKLTQFTTNSGNLRLTGGGQVVLSDSTGNLIKANLENTDNTISGAGTISGRIDNQATIRGGGATSKLVLDTGPNGHLANTGNIEAIGAGIVIGNPAAASHVRNAGSISSTNSTLVLEHVDVSNTGGSIAAGGTQGQLQLHDTRISGGTLGTASGVSLTVSGSTALTDVALQSNGALVVNTGATLRLSGGSNSINGSVTDNGRIDFDTNLDLQGKQAVVITGILSGLAVNLTNVDDSITGSGAIQVANLRNEDGTIGGDLKLKVGDRLDNFGAIDGSSVHARRVFNHGTMNAVAVKADRLDNEIDATISAAVLDISIGTGAGINNRGIILNSTFGRTTVKNANATIKADGHETDFRGTTVVGGTLAGSNGGTVRILADASPTVLKLDMLGSGTALSLANGSALQLANNQPSRFALDAVSISLAGSGQATSLTFEQGTYSLQGHGRITLSDSMANNVSLKGLLLNLDGTISGAGQIGGGALSALANESGGLIEAIGKNSLTIDVGELTNEGILEADGTLLKLVSTKAIEGGGKVVVEHGGTVDMTATPQYFGSFEYVGRGTIMGSKAVPAGTISGFATGDSYVFGQTSNFGVPLTARFVENGANTGGTLTIEAGTQTFATLQFNGVYSSTDFSANQVAFADGKHIVVNFVGAITWAGPVNGKWNEAAKWNPTALLVPGADDNVLITAAGSPYTVLVTEDARARTVATGTGATLSIKAGTFTAIQGTQSTANAGVVNVQAGGAFVTGGTFAQATGGKLAAHGAGARISLAKGGTISGGVIALDSLATLKADNGTGALTGVAVRNDGTIEVGNRSILTMTDSTVTGNGSVAVGAGSRLVLAESNVSDHTIALAGILDVRNSVVLQSDVELSQGSHIVAGGPAATLTSHETLRGTGEIGDGTSNLKFVNDGTVQTDPGNALTFATGDNAILNAGTMIARGASALHLLSGLNNVGTFRAQGGGESNFLKAVENTGQMEARGAGSILDFAGPLANSSTVAARDAGALFIRGQVTQQASGQLVASGNSGATQSTLDFFGGSGISGGGIVVSGLADLRTARGGTVTFKQTMLSIGKAAGWDISGKTTVNLVDSTVTSAGTAHFSTGTLALANATLRGGTYQFLSSSARLQVVGKGDVNDARLELGGSSIVSNGAAATFTNAGFITGARGVIGDANLTVVNDGTITANVGGSIRIATGSNAIVNNRTITTSDANSKVSIVGTLDNTATGRLLAGAGELAAARVENAGLVQASGIGRVDVQILVNTGEIVAKEGGSVTAISFQNSGNASASGEGSALGFGDASHVATNAKLVTAAHHSVVTFGGGVDNVRGGQLKATGGGEVKVIGAATGGVARIIGDGSVMDFEGSATASTTTNAVFDNDGLGQLMLNHSNRFAGTVAGFSTGDSIDVQDVGFVAGKSSYNAGTGILTVSDGGARTSNIQLLGHYTAADFAFASDGHGGTLITGTASADPAAPVFHHA